MILEKLKLDYKQALKDRNTINKGVLTLIISSINLKVKEKGNDLSDEEIYSVIQKELKQTKETLDLTPIDRVESINETKLKIELLVSYLPKQMSIDEVISAIKELNIELIKKNQGIIIKEMISKYSSSTDGKTINLALSNILK